MRELYLAHLLASKSKPSSYLAEAAAKPLKKLYAVISLAISSTHRGMIGSKIK